MKTRHIYSTPSLEVIAIAVEQGFAATDVTAGGEGGNWGGMVTSSYNNEQNEY